MTKGTESKLKRLGFPAGAAPTPDPFSDDSELKFYGKFSETSGDIINQSESSDSLGDSADIEISGGTYDQESFADWSKSLYMDGIDDYTISASDRIVLTWSPAGGTDPQVNVRTSNVASYDSAYNNKAAEWKTDSAWTISSVNSWWCFG